MRALKLLYLTVGIALVLSLAWNTDLSAIAAALQAFGWLGLAVVLCLYLAAFSVDAITWTITLTSVPMTVRWVAQTWLVRIAGEAFNSVMPAAGLGGEPLKAMLLKQRFGISYDVGSASLVLARTINMVSLCLFLAGGFMLMFVVPNLPAGTVPVAGAGLVAACGATAALVTVQRWRFSSRSIRWLSSLPGGGLIETYADGLLEFDQRLTDFYATFARRFVGAVALALLNWLLGVAEIYYAMAFLSVPVSWTEAYVIEAVTQMVRLGTFFIPLSLGAQEGAFVLMVGAITGSSPLGLAVAIIKRVREFIWIAAGLAVAVLLGLRPRSEGA